MHFFHTGLPQRNQRPPGMSASEGTTPPASSGDAGSNRKEAWGSGSDTRLPPSARKSPQQYSDRFIPSRRGVNLQDSFALLPDAQPKKRDAPQEGGKDDNLDTYTMLLRSEFLGSEPNGARRADDLLPASPQRNLFRYRAMPNSRADENAAYALSPVGSDSQRVLCSPRKAPRKISTVPYKVLDAPALQDDFYLNLVDWSSLNVLAVGLGTCVYLWSACTSKVTKLCDLGPEDSVRKRTQMAPGVAQCVQLPLWLCRRCHGAAAPPLPCQHRVRAHRVRAHRMRARHARRPPMALPPLVLCSGRAHLDAPPSPPHPSEPCGMAPQLHR